MIFAPNGAAGKYLEDVFLQNNTEYRIDASGREVLCVFDAERDFFENIVCDVVVKFRKYSVLNGIYGFDPERDISFYAYFGTVLSIESCDERMLIRAKIPQGTLLNIDGFFNFYLTEYIEIWKNLGVLTKKLYAHCASSGDLYALTAYLFGVEGLSKRSIVLDGGLYYNDGNEDIPIAEFTGDRERDVALNLFLNKPREIIVPHPELYDSGLIDFIKALGEKQV